MVSLLVLSAVLLALSLLTGQEPLAARNHMMMAQAQGMAEAGLDRALWALSTPGAPDGVPWDAPIPVPYDGSRLIGAAVDGVPLGGFRVTISGTGDRQRQIVATGLVPGDSGPIGQARQDISATAVRLRLSRSGPASASTRARMRPVGASPERGRPGLPTSLPGARSADAAETRPSRTERLMSGSDKRRGCLTS